MCETREPTDRELLYDIRQLLYKLVYGNKAEGLKSICKDNGLEKRIKELENKMSIIEAEISVLQCDRVHIYPNNIPHIGPMFYDNNQIMNPVMGNVDKNKKDK